MIQPPGNVLDIKTNDSDDSDWGDDDDDFRAKKINIKIKPAGQVIEPKISASVDELRATVDSWKSLANLNHLNKPTSRRSHYQSTVQLNNIDKLLNTQSILDDLIPNGLGLDAPQTVNNSNFKNHNLVEQINMQPPSQYHRSSIDNLLSGPEPGVVKPLEVLPIAIAIQECLNVRITPNNQENNNIHLATGLKGRLKIALPPKILNMILSHAHERLMLSFRCNFALNETWINDQFVTSSNTDGFNNQSMAPVYETSMITNNHFNILNNNNNDVDHYNNNNDHIIISVDTNALKDYVVAHYKDDTDAKYFILPELFRYEISSQGLATSQDMCFTPILGYCNWIHESNVTKIKIDIEILEQNLNQKFKLKSQDILDLKLTIKFKGTISSHQSKPQSILNPMEANKLIWTFQDLPEFMQKAEHNLPYYSCIARLENHQSSSMVDLVDDVELSFAIRGKSLAGTDVAILNDLPSFKLAMMKSEVRTGTFKIQSEPGI